MCLVALEHCGRRRELLNTVAARLYATPMGVALARLLERSPNILRTPGTSSIEHLRENVTGAALKLPDDALAELNCVATRHVLP
jgi:pyridoxine 4-dehydrogenase